MRISFRRLFSDRAYTIKAASALLALTALLSNALGLFRNIVFYRLIPTAQLDMYYASFRIPDFLFNLLIFGAISSAFVPIVTELISHKKREEAWEVSNQLLTWITVIFVTLAIVLALSMSHIMHAIVPGFDPERFATTVSISRIMLIQTVFFAWSFTLGGLLNSGRRFTTYAMAPLVYNLSIIAGGLLYRAHHNIVLVSYAVVVGSFLHLFIQYLELRTTGFRPRFDFRFTGKVKEIFRIMLPRSMSLGMAQLVLIAYTALASHLEKGSLAVFSGMNDLQTTPTVIIANSIAVAFFPTLAALVATKEWDTMNNLLTKAVRACLFLLLPTLALAFILRAQVVRLYFGIGGANWELTHLAIHTFVWFLVGITPASLVVLFSRVFYGFKNTRTPMYISIFAGAVAILIAFVGIRHFHGSVATLALADSTLSLIQATLYIYVFYRHNHIRLNLRTLMPKVGSYLLGSVIMAAGAWGTLRLIDFIYSQTGLLSTRVILGLFLQMVVAAAVGVLLFLGYSMLVHKEELQWIRKKRFTTNSQ